MKRYICIAGEIPSLIKGNPPQYFSAQQVMELWKVPRRECLFADSDEEAEAMMYKDGKLVYDKLGLIKLRPDPMRRYKLPIKISKR